MSSPDQSSWLISRAVRTAVLALELSVSCTMPQTAESRGGVLAGASSAACVPDGSCVFAPVGDESVTMKNTRWPSVCASDTKLNTRFGEISLSSSQECTSKTACRNGGLAGSTQPGAFMIPGM